MPALPTIQATAEGLVTALYDFNSHYFESHDIKDAARKASDVTEKMQQTVAELERLQGTDIVGARGVKVH